MLKKFALDLSHGLRTMVRGIDADWNFGERRRCLRFNCRHKVELYQGDDDKQERSTAYVLNYGLGGVRIAFPGNLKVGEKIKLKFPHPLPGVTARTLACEIVWRRKNSKTLEMLAGAKFTEPKDRMSASWIAYFFRERGSAAGDLRENRKYYRADCKLDVVARSDADRAVGEVHNLSLGGAFLRVNRPAEAGDEWLLDISGLSSYEGMHFKGKVLSCEMGEAGMYEQRIEFAHEDQEMVKLLRKYILTLSKDFWTE